MKDKILSLIIGILIGAIVTTCGFLIYNKTHKSEPQNGAPMQSMNGERPELPSGDNEKPDGEPPTRHEKNGSSNSNNNSNANSDTDSNTNSNTASE